MHNKNTYLLLAGTMMALASITHICIIFGGGDWYRFFGAGEEMAKLAEAGSIYPAQVTSFIVLVLAIGAFYALKLGLTGKKLPLQGLILGTAATVFLIRGLIGLPAVLLIDHPYLNELAERTTFMIISSLICLAMGGFLVMGLRNRN